MPIGSTRKRDGSTPVRLDVCVIPPAGFARHRGVGARLDTRGRTRSRNRAWRLTEPIRIPSRRQATSSGASRKSRYEADPESRQAHRVDVDCLAWMLFAFAQPTTGSAKLCGGKPDLRAKPSTSGPAHLITGWLDFTILEKLHGAPRAESAHWPRWNPHTKRPSRNEAAIITKWSRRSRRAA
jgi:hypothetical protein